MIDTLKNFTWFLLFIVTTLIYLYNVKPYKTSYKMHSQNTRSADFTKNCKIKPNSIKIQAIFSYFQS